MIAKDAFISPCRFFALVRRQSKVDAGDLIRRIDVKYVKFDGTGADKSHFIAPITLLEGHPHRVCILGIEQIGVDGAVIQPNIH